MKTQSKSGSWCEEGNGSHKPIIDNHGFLLVGPMKVGRIVFKEGTPLLEIKNPSGRKTRGYGKFSYSTVEDLIDVLSKLPTS